MQNKAYLLLGTNLGDRAQLLQDACKLITQKMGNIIAASKIYETTAWGGKDLPNHLNQALIVETSLYPFETLEQALAIELLLGRTREEKWGSRTMDIDIIFFNNDIILSEKLTLPHPRFQDRNFAMIPMLDIAAAYFHPILKKTVAEILTQSEDNLSVWPFNTAL